MGLVIGIFICPTKGKPMVGVPTIKALVGRGLEGDRYALGTGAWSNSKREVIRHVSLISAEAIAQSNSKLKEPFDTAETRRNILTKGIDLNALVGKEFSVGNVRMRGVELCDPCERPSLIANKKDFNSAFKGRGGLRAEILSDGTISLGNTIILPRKN
jgi:hypothetical protein